MENHLSQNAISYTISQLLHIAGLSESQFFVSGMTASIGGFQIAFTISNKEEQDALFRGDTRPTMVKSADGKIDVPIFNLSGECLITCESSVLFIHADLLTVSFALLTRYEETLTERRDQYGRFSYEDSLAKKYDFIQIPVVDEYAMLLRSALNTCFPALVLTARKATVTPTHDVDELWRFRNPFKALKSIIGGDLLLRKSLSTAMRSCRQLAQCRCRPEYDQLYTACFHLMDDSQQVGLISEFYFMGYQEDYCYSVLHPSVSVLMSEMERRGHIVGFHGGFGTCTDGENYRNQKSLVEKSLGKPVIGGRQHYLCFDALKTPRVWDDAGMKYDTTLSFYSHEGFMCGTCHPYPLYDLRDDHPLSVMERPLLLMDVTAKEYRKLSISEALDSAYAMLDRVMAVKGNFVLLWHNGSLDRGMEDWYHDFYQAFLQNATNRIKCAQGYTNLLETGDQYEKNIVEKSCG